LSEIPARLTRQRIEALEVANAVRAAQAQLKQAIKHGELDPVLIVLGQDDVWGRFAEELKLEPLLRSVPRFGRRTVHSILTECGLYPNSRLKQLSPETRQLLAHTVAAVQRREDELIRRTEID
jgi:hypothetical protein